MKNLKKVICVILVTMFVVCACQCGVSAVYFNKETEKEGVTNFLVLGDSIAEGYGVVNNDEAAYGRIVADTNGWNYRNFARVANDTSDLLYKLENDEDIIESIAWADVINICIGSNNYLANDDVVLITIGALLRVNAAQLDEIAEQMYEDYLKIYDMIRKLNPDATLIFNKIYCAWKGLGHIPFIQAVDRINAKLDDLHAAHSDVVLFDTGTVITHNTELIADDCVHPNAKGNVALAKAFLGLLKELGLSTKTEPENYTEGIDYNFYVSSFGYVAGYLICGIVKVLTGNT